MSRQPDARPGPPPITAIRALLPVRFFFGATFLYAGFDKLIDPSFLDPSSPASIQAQMAIFTRVSPIAALVRLGQPVAVPIGILIAIAEIAIGLGALTGLAFRVAAWGGAALSILFFLTASWATRPFYYGPDLPYAAGWIALALAGHGGLLLSRRLLAWAGGDSATDPATPRPAGAELESANDPSFRDRRTVLQAGVLSLFALVAASLAVPFRQVGASQVTPDEGDAGSSGGPSPSAIASPSGLVVARIADVTTTGARAFTVPFSAPAPLPAGDPAVIVKLADGSYVAFDAVCTHAGCTVQWDRADQMLLCPCHGAVFDPASGAKVLEGPTNQPLTSIPIVVDAASGTISLQV